MNIELINPHVMKILIATRKIDSISAISKRINLSYGWTQKWIKELVREGIFKERYRGIELQETKEYKEVLNLIKKISKNVNFYYSVLNLFGIKYCFTKTDAVYVWTNGGYNVARYKDYYPIFIKIRRSDYQMFLFYCRKLGLKVNKKEGIFYSPEIAEDFNHIIKNDYPVESLEETIKFMKEYIYNFQPALEMIKEEYKKKLKVKYKEAVTNA